MKLHIITVGSPKLNYAKTAWDEYFGRLKHQHQVRVTHLADKQNDTAHLLAAAGSSYKVALVIDNGKQFSSPDLAKFLEKRALEGREVSFIIGGPEGLPLEVIAQSDLQWSFSDLTFPHDLAMIILLEALYRASSINQGLPYHRA
jgi:23S rRNA (pseudouridine1915-N3)-methyltransferase